MPTQELASKSVAERETLAAVEGFNRAFNDQDIDATMEVMTDDCVFENTYPPPDGERFEGRQSVRQAFEEFFRSSPGARFEAEEIFATGCHCVVRWTYRWTDGNEDSGHVRGVDVFRVHEGQIASKMAYVKG